jgi:hypothetical protein
MRRGFVLWRMKDAGCAPIIVMDLTEKIEGHDGKRCVEDKQQEWNWL